MLNPFEKIKIPPEVEDFIKSYINKLPSIGGTTVKDREIRRIKSLEDSLSRYTDFINTFPRIDKLHPFYQEMVKIASGGDVDKLKMCLGAINRAVLLSRKITRQYISLIRKNPEEEANKLMRQCVGRVSSILRQRSECVSWSIKVAKTLRKLNAIDPSLPTIIIAGAPNVGKSTLVGKISSAKPEVASYPFTTKEIHVGHIDMRVYKVQVIDTPGILDRPMSKRNNIELQAINAIKNLEGIILFIFDVSKTSLYGSKEQIDLYKEVKSLGKKVIPVLNKIDEKDENLYTEIKSETNAQFEISAEKGEGIGELLNYVLSLIKNEIGNKILD
ncbi:NOG1 family protein [Stygiolobus caldivivus]|uniref:GTP-binding protein n=1 Tax=Stygiolobus caldivivus TaxID=2824673 RepID=A0A8D5U9G7_9CREN|nr:GTPase [Stygiolobus caldivivus]BCU71392.1 GTP-binding protein [Stygiolobus caldivivus]